MVVHLPDIKQDMQLTYDQKNIIMITEFSLDMGNEQEPCDNRVPSSSLQIPCIKLDNSIPQCRSTPPPPA